MKIKYLHLENFRVHADSVLQFGDSSFCVIRGRNFAGKSTIGQALSMCLTPSTTGLDSRGTGFASKIKRGTTRAAITIHIQAKHHLIERTVTLSHSGRSQTSTCLSDPDWNAMPFDRKLEASRGALTVVLNTDAFLRMDEKEQKNLLAGLALPARYDFDPEIVQSVENALGRGEIIFGGEPFALINSAYKKLFDERQIVNRQVRDFIIPEPLPMAAGVDSRELQERLTTLNMERREKQMARDVAVRDATRIEVEREHIKAKERSLLTDEKLAYLRKVAAGKEELKRLNEEKKPLERVIDDCLRELGRLEEMPEGGQACPLCNQLIDPQKLSERAVAVDVALREAKEKNFAIYAAIKALGDVEEAIKAVAAHEQTRGELVAIEHPEPVLFDFQPYDKSLTEIDAEIESISAQLRPVIAAEERRKEIAIRQEQLSRVKQRAASLDRLVKFFGPDGIKAKLIGEYIGGFEAKLNEVLTAWGYSCALSIEPYQFDITNARGDVIPARELSGAERIMFSLAFQSAVSRTANIGLVVIDEVALLLPELRTVLNKRMYEMLEKGYLEQIIFLVSDTSEQVPSLPGSAFFMVEDGVVYALRSGLRAEHAEPVRMAG